VISKHLRLDKGTETGDMATIHIFIRQTQEDADEAAETVHHNYVSNYLTYFSEPISYY
jgi:hypothetical protein